MSKLMIIDGNAIGYSSHNTNVLYAGDMQTQAVFHFVKTMRKLITMFADYKVLVLWDRPATWRYDLFPDYKSNRSDDPEKIARREAYKKQRPYIYKAINALGIAQINADDYEADDLAGFYAAASEKANIEVLLVTGDQDWIQLVGKNCIWFDPIRDRMVKASNFVEETGYPTPELFVDGKALTGDGSDCIPGIGGFGEKGAPEFINQYGGVKAFLKLADEGKLPKKLPAASARLANNTAPNPSKKYGVMLPARDAYERNIKLMDLRNKPAPPTKNLVPGKFDQDRFEEICAELAFHSLLKGLENWIQPFKERSK